MDGERAHVRRVQLNQPAADVVVQVEVVSRRVHPVSQRFRDERLQPQEADRCGRAVRPGRPRSARTAKRGSAPVGSASSIGTAPRRRSLWRSRPDMRLPVSLPRSRRWWASPERKRSTGSRKRTNRRVRGAASSEQRRDPREVDVVGCPLAGQPAGWTREPLVVQRAFRRAERAGCIPAKEMALLVDVVAGVDVRMCAHGVVPPGGAGLLCPDPHEVRCPRDLVSRRPGWSGIEAVLPRRVFAERMKDRPPGWRGQPGKGGHGDPAYAASSSAGVSVRPVLGDVRAALQTSRHVHAEDHPRQARRRRCNRWRPRPPWSMTAYPRWSTNRSNSSRTCSSMETFSARC